MSMSPPPPQAPIDYYGTPPPRRPGSVTAIAIIGIILAAAGILCVGGSGVFSLISPNNRAMAQNAPQLFMTGMAMIVVSLLLSGVLLVGSIGLLMLKAWRRTLMIVFAVLDLIFDVAKLAVSVAFSIPKTLEVMRDHPPSNLPPQQVQQMQTMAPMMRNMMLGSAVVGFAISAIFAIVVILVLQTSRARAAFAEPPLPPI